MANEIKKIKVGSTDYDIRDDSKLPLTGGTLTGNLILASGTVTATNGYNTVSAGGATSIGLKFWKGTQAQYNSISSKDANTFYIIVG